MIAKSEEAVEQLYTDSIEFAEAENAYRRKRAHLQIVAPDVMFSMGFSKPTVDEKAAYVDQEAASEMLAAHRAEALMLAGRLAVKSRESQLSALQSVLRVIEAEFNASRRAA